MTRNDWTQRVGPRNAPPDLSDLRDAARELDREGKKIPGRTGTMFQNVSQCLILASVLATTSLAIFHLWKELCRSHEKSHPHPAANASGRPHTSKVASPAAGDGHHRGQG